MRATGKKGCHLTEGATLHDMGLLFRERFRYDVTLACLLLAQYIFEEAMSPNLDEVQKSINQLSKRVDKDRFAALLAEVEPQAQQIVEKALDEK